MRKIKNNHAHVLFESLIGFVIISSILFIFSMSMTQFYRREQGLLRTVHNLQQVDSSIVKQQAFLSNKDVTMHYNGKEVIINEGQNKIYTISMEE